VKAKTRVPEPNAKQKEIHLTNCQEEKNETDRRQRRKALTLPGGEGHVKRGDQGSMTGERFPKRLRLKIDKTIEQPGFKDKEIITGEVGEMGKPMKVPTGPTPSKTKKGRRA